MRLSDNLIDELLKETITDVATDEVKAWQHRPLEALYLILFMDTLHIKIRDQGHLVSKAIHLVLGVDLEGKMKFLASGSSKMKEQNFG